MLRKENFTLNYHLLYALLIVAPFLFFFLHNVTQIEFIGIEFLWFFLGYISFYFLIFIICTNLFPRRSRQLLIFLAAFSFLQFYYLDFRASLGLIGFQYGGYITLSLIGVVSLSIGYFSRWRVSRTFLLIFLSLNSFSYLPSLLSIFQSQDAKVELLSDLIAPSETLGSSSSNRRENIYYIIPDGMTSPKNIQSYFGLDINNHIDNLVKKGFSVPAHNYSAYNVTYLTLASLFNMDYVVTDKTEPYNDRSNFYPSLLSKRTNLVDYLKSNGYRIILFPASWGGCPKSTFIQCLKPINITILDHYSVNTFLRGSLIGRMLRFLEQGVDQDDSIPTAIEYMKTEPYLWSNGGVFTIVHTIIPHPPYRDENCSIITSYENNFNREKYNSSVLCALKRIEEITNFIIDNDPDAVVIVQSDHGVTLPRAEVEAQEPFDNLPHEFIDANMAIFNAVYGCGANIAAKKNQVNIVNFVVECLKGTIIENNVDNISYYGFYENHWLFGKVFEVKKR